MHSAWTFAWSAPEMSPQLKTGSVQTMDRLNNSARKSKLNSPGTAMSASPMKSSSGSCFLWITGPLRVAWNADLRRCVCVCVGGEKSFAQSVFFRRPILPQLLCTGLRRESSSLGSDAAFGKHACTFEKAIQRLVGPGLPSVQTLTYWRWPHTCWRREGFRSAISSVVKFRLLYAFVRMASLLRIKDTSMIRKRIQ